MRRLHVYEESRRQMPSRLGDFEYADTAEVRRVRGDGYIKWDGEHVFVGTAMRGELIGIQPVGYSDWHVFLGPVRLGALVEERGLIVPLSNQR